jgi:hypothetical protein
MAFIFSKIGIHDIHVMYERVGVLERENTVFPMNCVQWELGAKTKHQRIGVFNLSATQEPVQDSVGASG